MKLFSNTYDVIKMAIFDWLPESRKITYTCDNDSTIYFRLMIIINNTIFTLVHLKVKMSLKLRNMVYAAFF